MKHALLFLVVTSLMVLFSIDADAAHSRSAKANNVEDFRAGAVDYDAAAVKQMTKQQSREQAKLLKHQQSVERKKQRVAKLFSKLQKKASAGDSSGIGLALLIILIGAALALLGLVGIADLLITVGIVVLAVGLVIWLVTAIS